MTAEQNIDEHRYHAIRVELKQYQRCPLTEHQSRPTGQAASTPAL